MIRKAILFALLITTSFVGSTQKKPTTAKPAKPGAKSGAKAGTNKATTTTKGASNITSSAAINAAINAPNFSKLSISKIGLRRRIEIRQGRRSKLVHLILIIIV